MCIHILLFTLTFSRIVLDGNANTQWSTLFEFKALYVTEISGVTKCKWLFLCNEIQNKHWKMWNRFKSLYTSVSCTGFCFLFDFFFFKYRFVVCFIISAWIVTDEWHYPNTWKSLHHFVTSRLFSRSNSNFVNRILIVELQALFLNENPKCKKKTVFDDLAQFLV